MSFIHAAEAALDARANHAQSDAAIDVLPLQAPPVFDADGLRAVLSPFIAGFLWAAAILRERMAHQSPLDPMALLLRVLALALTLRMIFALLQLAQRLRVRLAYRHFGLALADEGLLFRAPHGAGVVDRVILREEIVDVRERGDWRGRSGRRWGEVYVITRAGSSAGTHVALPPVFMETPGLLAEYLMRWLASTGTGGGASAPEPATSVAEDQALPSKLWERAAAGERPEGVSVIPQGNGWMARGPYASVLVGLAVLDGYLRLPSDVRANLTTHGPLLLPLLLVGVPVSWVLWKRRGLAANRGVALLVTPADLLLRTSAGVMRVAWSSIARVEVATMRRWSLLRGAYEDRALVLHRKHVEDIHYSEAFLAVPAEVVAGLCDAQRKSAAAAAPESTPAS